MTRVGLALCRRFHGSQIWEWCCWVLAGNLVTLSWLDVIWVMAYAQKSIRRAIVHKQTSFTVCRSGDESTAQPEPRNRLLQGSHLHTHKVQWENLRGLTAVEARTPFSGDLPDINVFDAFIPMP